MENCFEIKDFDGFNLPSFVNEILNLNLGKIFFGGSSLLHDLYFPQEQWKNRDYDIWCHSSEFKLIQKYLQQKKINKIENNQNYYHDNNIKNIENYQIENNILQIINVNKIKNIISKIDFSFNTVFYDGLKLYFIKTFEEEVKNKIGYFLYQPELENRCVCCIRNDNNLQNRFEKYSERGFKFENICPLCLTNPNKKILTLEHILICVFKKLQLRYDIYFHKLTIDKTFIKILNQMEEREEIMKNLRELMKENKNNSYFYGFILMFNNFFEEVKFNPRLINNEKSYLELILLNLGKIGLTSLFKDIYSYYYSLYPNKKFEKKVLNIVCDENNITTAEYLMSLNPKISLKIQGDFIYNFEIKSLFTCFLENKNINDLIEGIKNSKIFDGNDECIICKKNNTDISLECNHSFCGNCISEYFQLKQNKKEKLQCPICRSEVELSE